VKPEIPSYDDKIPMLDLTEEIREHWEAYNQAFQKVLSSGHFILGPEVRQLEESTAEYLGVKHAVGLNSGTDALVIGLRALGIKPGDEVITSPFSFFATGEAISLLGAVPVFVDIEPSTFNLDVSLIEQKITKKTKAILPVHLFGQASDMEAIQALAQKHGLLVFEDAAQAMGGDIGGKKLGSFGHAAAFSFFPTKNLGAFGDGGLFVTNDDRVADQARLLRVHGSKKRYHHEALGYTSRLDEMQAAFLRLKLKTLDERNEKRLRAAHRYTEALIGLEGIIPPFIHPRGRHIFHQYTITVPEARRDALQKALTDDGISTIIYYPIPIHLTEHFHLEKGLCPVTESMALRVISLPLWPEIPTGVQERVTSRIRTFWKSL